MWPWLRGTYTHNRTILARNATRASFRHRHYGVTARYSKSSPTTDFHQVTFPETDGNLNAIHHHTTAKAFYTRTTRRHVKPVRRLLVRRSYLSHLDFADATVDADCPTG